MTATTSFEQLVENEYNLFKRSPDWELNNIRKALKSFEWLNTPQQRARLSAIGQIKRERRAAKQEAK